MRIDEFKNAASAFSAAEKMPVLFLGHGNPMNVITDNHYRGSWEELGRKLTRPAAVLCISAHWYTNGTYITTNERQRTIHDFGGFPDELFAQRYNTPGAPELAEETIVNVMSAEISGARDWGLDHGSWCVLKPMFPAADVPVFQLSIDYTKPPAFHYEMGKELAFLRSRGVLIIGSGNIVHNLRLARWQGGSAYDWAQEFDHTARKALLEHNDRALVEYEQFGEAARLSVPTNEHYLPLLYALGAAAGHRDVEIFNDDFDLSSISMMSALFA